MKDLNSILGFSNAKAQGVDYINTGGSHEKNKYGGVQISTDPNGAPNLVEQGEVILDGTNVLSKTLKITSDVATTPFLKAHVGESFAGAFKAEYEALNGRNDAVTKNEIKNIKEQLFGAQESLKQAKEEAANKAKADAISEMPAEDIQAKAQADAEAQAMEQQQGQADMMAQQLGASNIFRTGGAAERVKDAKNIVGKAAKLNKHPYEGKSMVVKTEGHAPDINDLDLYDYLSENVPGFDKLDPEQKAKAFNRYKDIAKDSTNYQENFKKLKGEALELSNKGSMKVRGKDYSTQADKPESSTKVDYKGEETTEPASKKVNDLGDNLKTSEQKQAEEQARQLAERIHAADVKQFEDEWHDDWDLHYETEKDEKRRARLLDDEVEAYERGEDYDAQKEFEKTKSEYFNPLKSGSNLLEIQQNKEIQKEAEKRQKEFESKGGWKNPNINIDDALNDILTLSDLEVGEDEADNMEYDKNGNQTGYKLYRTTSGYRTPGEAGAAGDKSFHTKKNSAGLSMAHDVTPGNKRRNYADFADDLNKSLAYTLYKNARPGSGVINESNNWGNEILNEEGAQNKTATKATGNHLHLGPDKIGTDLGTLARRAREEVLADAPENPIEEPKKVTVDDVIRSSGNSSSGPRGNSSRAELSTNAAAGAPAPKGEKSEPSPTSKIETAPETKITPGNSSAVGTTSDGTSDDGSYYRGNQLSNLRYAPIASNLGNLIMQSQYMATPDAKAANAKLKQAFEAGDYTVGPRGVHQSAVHLDPTKELSEIERDSTSSKSAIVAGANGNRGIVGSQLAAIDAQKQAQRGSLVDRYNQANAEERNRVIAANNAVDEAYNQRLEAANARRNQARMEVESRMQENLLNARNADRKTKYALSEALSKSLAELGKDIDNKNTAEALADDGVFALQGSNFEPRKKKKE